MRIFRVFVLAGSFLAVAGCSSIHPLPENYAGSGGKTFDIVRKIRCEAREAVIKHAVVDNNNFSTNIGYALGDVKQTGRGFINDLEVANNLFYGKKKGRPPICDDLFNNLQHLNKPSLELCGFVDLNKAFREAYQQLINSYLDKKFQRSSCIMQDELKRECRKLKDEKSKQGRLNNNPSSDSRIPWLSASDPSLADPGSPDYSAECILNCQQGSRNSAPTFVKPNANEGAKPDAQCQLDCLGNMTTGGGSGEEDLSAESPGRTGHSPECKQDPECKNYKNALKTFYIIARKITNRMKQMYMRNLILRNSIETKIQGQLDLEARAEISSAFDSTKEEEEEFRRKQDLRYSLDVPGRAESKECPDPDNPTTIEQHRACLDILFGDNNIQNKENNDQRIYNNAIAQIDAIKSNYSKLIGEYGSSSYGFKRNKIDNLLKAHLRDTVIAYEFKFTINETDNGSANSTFTFPFTNGNFALDLSFGEDKARKNVREFDVVEYFAELVADEDLRKYCAIQENWQYPITGKIGLAEVIETYSQLADLNKFNLPYQGSGSGSGQRSGGNRGEGGEQNGRGGQSDGDGDPGQSTSKPKGSLVQNFSDELTFTTTYTGSVKPSLELNPVSHDFRLTKASGSFGGERKDTHTVSILIKTQTDDDNPKNEIIKILNDRKRVRAAVEQLQEGN